MSEHRDADAVPEFFQPAYGARLMSEPIPKNSISDPCLPPQVVYDLIRDELILDGSSRLNLATFVTTFMEKEAKTLMAETFDKNMIDKDEYPQTAQIEQRCVRMISELWNGPTEDQATGCSTIGSSEAAMFGGMALKWKWRARQRVAGKPTDKPNMVMGINVQVCWEKFCRYWDIEPRFVPMEGNRFCLSAEEAVKRVDENTIGVVGIMGSTFDGRYEDIKSISNALDEYEKSSGLDIPIHVDGASGGFVAPFLQPDIEWDFRLPRVHSINASGHKFGLVYPGVGWIIWKNREALPEDLVFHCNYLGGDLPNFALNFSRPGNQVIAQYYNFLRLGREGYRRIHQTSQEVALYLSGSIKEMGPFDLISDGSDIPVFAFTTNDSATFSSFDMSDKLRERGWLVPAYTFPKNREDIAAMRCVCKEGFTHDLAESLVKDMKDAIEFFNSRPDHVQRKFGSAFHH